jgi:cysteine desulfurase
MGLSPIQAHSSIRLSLGKRTTADQIDFVLSRLPEAVARLRALSPLWTNGR